MIQTEITFRLPEVRKDLTSILHKIGERMVRSVQTNFERGGRPAWPATRSGETPLVLTGKLKGSIGYRLEGNDTVIIAPITELKYAAIHQFGGITHPTVTVNSKKFFWAMWFETKNDMWKAMALKSVGSKLNVVIPPRPYLLFQQEDIDWMMNLLENSIIISGRFERYALEKGTSNE